MVMKRGTKIKNRYEIIEVIGEGGFGTTYKAVDHLINRFVAIKCSSNSLTHEAKILKVLKDVPHISHIYDYFIIDGQYFIVMRYIAGTSLSRYREEKGGTLSIGEIKEMLPAVLITLDQMHERGVIHRDISPGNFILTDEGILYLIDFGAATSVKENNLINNLIFRHRGLDAPEFADVSKQGPWTDIYSLCRTLVYLLTGEGIPDVGDRIVYDPVPLLMVKLSISGRMQNALLKGLSIDPQKRYRTIQSFAKDFLGTRAEINSIEEEYSVHYHAKTFIGKRDVNQDNFMVDRLFAYAGEDCEIKGYIDCRADEYHVVAVADGVTSVNHAELASKAAIQAVSHFIDNIIYEDALAENLIEEFLNQLNEKILILGKKIGMTATTITIFLWKRDNYCVANIGDSPVYQLSEGKLNCLSIEHTIAREGLEKGKEVKVEDFHKLTKYLGCRDTAGSQMAYIRTGKISKGDIFLMCTDGIARHVSDMEKARYIRKDGDKAMKKLFRKAESKSNMDNGTAIILKF